MDQISLRAFAKINLGLDVLGRRDNGYHDVRMVMQNVRIFDRIMIRKTEEPGFLLETDVPFIPTDSHNLMVKAAALMFETYSLPGGLSMKLEKTIPVAAGMGGGSSDAAAVFHGINLLYDLKIPREELMRLGLSVGADVPFCILQKTALAEGIGEELSAISPCPPCHILIAKPPVAVSTKTIYQEIDSTEIPDHPDIDALVGAMNEKDLPLMCSLMGNVLERVTEKMHPSITQIEKIMEENGALKAMMSGSGPTVFGIFDSQEKGKAAMRAVKKSRLASAVRLTSPMN